MGIGSFAIQLQMWSLNAVNTVMIDKKHIFLGLQTNETFFILFKGWCIASVVKCFQR